MLSTNVELGSPGETRDGCSPGCRGATSANGSWLWGKLEIRWQILLKDTSYFPLNVTVMNLTGMLITIFIKEVSVYHLFFMYDSMITTCSNQSSEDAAFWTPLVNRPPRGGELTDNPYKMSNLCIILKFNYPTSINLTTIWATSQDDSSTIIAK